MTKIFGNDVENSFKIDKNGTEIDIFVKKYSFGIEYDGVYFHKNRIEHDLKKNTQISYKGYKLIRIREQGLAKLSNHDLIFDYTKSYNLENFKSTLLKVFNYMKTNFKLSTQELKNIENISNINLNTINIPKSFLIYPLVENSLFKTNINIAKLFHLDKNYPLTSKMITSDDNQLCVWSCVKCSGEFTRTVCVNVQQYGLCNVCHSSEN